MNWFRSGRQQREKVKDQYDQYEGNPGLAMMKKHGFVIGKGLGNGHGRLGEPWGLQGRWVRSGSTTTRRTYMVTTLTPLYAAIPGAPFPPMVPAMVPVELEREEPRWRWKAFRCYELWGCPYLVEPASRYAGVAKDCELFLGIPCSCCVCALVPGGAGRLNYFPHRSTNIITVTITTIINRILLIIHIIIVITTHRCAKDWFGLGWDESKVEELTERCNIQLNMFTKAEETELKAEESKVERIEARMSEVSLKPSYEAPKLPLKSKFNYKTEVINSDRNYHNIGVKSSYNENDYTYEPQVSVLIVGTSITNQSLIIKNVKDETKATIKMLRCYTVQGKDGKYKTEENIEDLLEDSVEKFKPDIITVETLVNEISNLGDNKPEETLVKEMKGKVKSLMKLLKKVDESNPNMKIIVIKPLRRMDSQKKQTISEIVGEGLVKGAKKSRIMVRSLALQLEDDMDQVMVFGKKGSVDDMGRHRWRRWQLRRRQGWRRSKGWRRWHRWRKWRWWHWWKRWRLWKRCRLWRKLRLR